jgi:predicted negative regulator of RcsB-dependent stress response
MSGVNLGRVRQIYKLMDIARQPGGLKTISDAELVALTEHVRGRLAAAEASKRGKKARRGWREALDRAETEFARREVEGA